MAAPHPSSLPVPAPSADLADRKRALRRVMRGARRDFPAEDALTAALHRNLDACVASRPGPIAATWPLPGEVDLRLLLRRWHDRGKAVCLPRVQAPDTPLTFHLWTPGAPLADGPHGTRHPDGPAVRPGLVLAPLLAFDRAGHRLGYGGGYYDRTLAALGGPPAIGFGWSWQEVTNVPAGQYDRPLDMIATEAEVIRIGV